MKKIFVHKAPHEEKTNISKKLPIILDQHLQTELSEVETYLNDNYGTTPSAFTYKEYTNVTTLESEDPTFSTAIVALTSTERMLNHPDNSNDNFIKHLGTFIKYLMTLSKSHQIQHLAIAFSKNTDDLPNAVKTADITCIRLY